MTDQKEPDTNKLVFDVFDFGFNVVGAIAEGIRSAIVVTPKDEKKKRDALDRARVVLCVRWAIAQGYAKVALKSGGSRGQIIRAVEQSFRDRPGDSVTDDEIAIMSAILKED